MTDYENYLDKYCKSYRISRSEAEQHAIVRSYKQYCEEKEKAADERKA